MSFLETAGPQNTGESVRGVVNRVIATPNKALCAAEFVIADWKVRLRSTCPNTTEIYSNRLRSRRPIAVTNYAGLTLNLLETSALGWAPPESYSDWRGPPGHFEAIAKEVGLRGVYLQEIEEEGTDPCTIFDPCQQVGVQLVTRFSDLPPWDVGAPCRILLNLAAVSRGWCLMHAATLSLANEGVLIVGPGGSGKSGTTLAGISAGLKSAGDDYVLVCPSDPPTAFRVYNVFKQDRNRLARIHRIAATNARLKTNWKNKVEFDPEDLFPGCMVERVRLHAMLAPKITYTPQTCLAEIDPQLVFQQLAPSLWTQLPGAPVSGFRFATWLTRRLPTYSVSLSDRPAEIGDTIANFIGGLTK
jgi:hypothetical protein